MKWLKRIILFPMAIFMGVDGLTSDAGAVSPESQPAAAESGTVEASVDAGAVSPESQPAAVVGEPGSNDVNTTGQEGGATTTEGTHKKTLEERVKELAVQQEAEIEARILAKLQPQVQTAKPDFIPDLDPDKVNAYIGQTLDQIEQLRLEGKHAEALDLQDDLNATRHAIRENEAKKAAYMKRQEEIKLSEQQITQINERIAEASILVAREHNIPPEVWKAGEDFFIKERQAKPLLDAQYREMVMLQGPVAALLWAKGYVEQNMGKAQQDLIQQKETAKESLPQGKTAVGSIPNVGAELAALKAKAASGNPEDLAAYSRALRESKNNTTEV